MCHREKYFKCAWSWDSVVGIVTGLQAGHSGVLILAGPRDRYLSPKCQDQLWGTPSLLICGYPVSFQGWSLLWLKISGAVHLLSLYAFMAWIETTFIVKVLCLIASEILKNFHIPPLNICIMHLAIIKVFYYQLVHKRIVFKEY